MSDVQIAGFPANMNLQQVTIASGASASEMIATQGRALVGIFMPAAWTAADIGYKAGWNGNANNLVQVYDGSGSPEHTVAVAAHYVAIPASDALFVPFIQLLSVSTADDTTAVTQGADRVLYLVFRNYLS